MIMPQAASGGSRAADMQRGGLLSISIMPDDGEAKQTVVDHLSQADIVNDEGTVSICRSALYYYADVLDSASKIPANDVAGTVILWSGRAAERRTETGEKGHEIRNTPMIDVSISAFHPPELRIHGEVRTHVLVHFLLQIDAQLAIGTNHYISANAFACRHIALGVSDAEIRRVVYYLLTGERECGIG